MILIINLILLLALGYLLALGIRQAVEEQAVAAGFLIMVSCIGRVAICIAFGELKTARP